ERPEIIIKVKHQETQALLLKPFGELDSGRCLSRGAGTANPHHPQFVARIKAAQYFGRGLVQRHLVKSKGFIDKLLDSSGSNDFIQTSHAIATAQAIPGERPVHIGKWKPIAGKVVRSNSAFAQP